VRQKSAALAPCILTSSIWTEPSDIRVVWITLLALATKTGKVSASIKKLAELANVTREVATQAIQILSSKDERSRDRDGDGRRIEILADGFRIINFDKYNEPLKKIPAKTVGTGVSLDYSTVQAIKYDFFRQYYTDLPEVRIYRELNELGEENPSDICRAFRAYIKDTPAKFFSWNKFRDIWRSYLKETPKQSGEAVFDKIAGSHTGYSPSTGVFWTGTDVKNKFGEKAFEAFEKIGGDAKLRSMTNFNMPFIKKAFCEAYDR
jgi:hypothetical protein